MFRFIMKSKKNVFSIILIQTECCKVFLLQGVTFMTRTIDSFDSLSTKMDRGNHIIVSKYSLLTSVRMSITKTDYWSEICTSFIKRPPSWGWGEGVGVNDGHSTLTLTRSYASKSCFFCHLQINYSHKKEVLRDFRCVETFELNN
jgi:hypothetical protein